VRCFPCATRIVRSVRARHKVRVRVPPSTPGLRTPRFLKVIVEKILYTGRGVHSSWSTLVEVCGSDAGAHRFRLVAVEGLIPSS
jgi:hypothetical protein